MMLTVNKTLADKILDNVYKQYSQLLLRYCTARLRHNKEAAEDCMQNAYLIFYKRILSGEEIVNPKAFLYRTADNMVMQADAKFLKEAKKRASLDEAETITYTEREHFAGDIDYDVIKEILLKNLKDDEIELYRMKYEQDMSLKEIAKILSIQPSAVANRISRMRKKVKTLISPTLEEYLKGGL